METFEPRYLDTSPEWVDVILKSTNMKEFKSTDLQVGDILIFENNDFSLTTFWKHLKEDYEEKDPEKRTQAAFYLLLYMISWFDPGDEGADYKNIYHAAIWGSIDTNRGKGKPKIKTGIVQAGRQGIGIADLEKTLTKKDNGIKNIWVYRRKKRPDDFWKKITDQMQAFYDDSSITYAYETAWMLAVICSMRYSDGKIYELLERHLGSVEASAVVIMIERLINDYNNKHQKDMVVCSTLVAMIYENAGFPIHVEALTKNPEPAFPSHFKLLPDLLHSPGNQRNKLTVPEITATVITPRQLAESRDVMFMGVLPGAGGD